MISTSISGGKSTKEELREVLIDYIHDLAILYSASKDDIYTKKVARVRLLLQEVG
jgi:hypothetical protein